MMAKNNYIQGLRGYLIFLIVLFHYTTRFSELYNQDYKFISESFVQIPIILFFSISGYFSSRNIFNLKKSNFTAYIQNIGNRCFRLYPAYAISVCIIFLILLFLPIGERNVGIKDFLINIIFMIHPGVPYVDGAHWFISDLLMIDIIFALLICIKNKILGFSIFSIVLISIWFGMFLNFNPFVIFHKYSLFSSMIGFSLGVVTFLMLNNSYKWILCMILFVSIEVIRSNLFFLVFFLIYFICLFPQNKLAILDRSKKIIYRSHILDNTLIVEIGNISLYWYLLHQNIGYGIILLFVNNEFPYYYGLIFAIAITIFLSIAIDRILRPFPKKIFR